MDKDAMITVVVSRPFLYNVRNCCWSLLPPISSPRTMAGCTSGFDRRQGPTVWLLPLEYRWTMMESSRYLSSAVEEYDPVDNRWLSLPDVPKPIAVRLIVAAEQPTADENGYDIVEPHLSLFSVESMQWNKLPDLILSWPPACRSRNTCWAVRRRLSASMASCMHASRRKSSTNLTRKRTNRNSSGARTQRLCRQLHRSRTGPVVGSALKKFTLIWCWSSSSFRRVSTKTAYSVLCYWENSL